MEKFSEFMEYISLIDLLLEGGSYTWSSGTDQPSMSRLTELWFLMKIGRASCRERVFNWV